MNITASPSARATSLIDVLATLSVLGLIATMSVVIFRDTPEISRETRLRSQTEALNASIQLYLTSGGNLAGATTAQAVIDKLKTVASEGEKLPGFRGNFVDPRLEIEMQTPAEAQDATLRAVWNPGEANFLLVKGGLPGIKAFHINESETAQITLAENRSLGWEFSASDTQGNWVWDYNRDTTDPVTSSMSTVPSGSGENDPEGSGSSKTQLFPPLFSMVSGSYPLSEFDLSLTLENPNPAGSSAIYVSQNGAAYQPYEGPLTIAPDTSITAFAAPTNSEVHYPSFTRTEGFHASGTVLTPPVFSEGSAVCCDTEFPKAITLTNPNTETPSEMVYSLNGGEEIVYTGPLTVTENTQVAAYCRSSESDPDVYDSPFESHLYESMPEVQLAAPTMSPDGGQHEDLVLVTLSSGIEAPAGSRIVYTTDGTDPGIDENGDPIQGTLYSEALEFSTSTIPGNPGDYFIDWDTDLWNDGQGWLDNQWDITQTLTNIGGSGIDVAVNLHGGPPTGDVPGPNLAEFSPLGLQTNLRSTAGDLPDFYYSLSFSQAVRLDDFATGGLFTYFDEMLANRIDLFDASGNQISLDTSFVTAYDHARIDTLNDGIETTGTSVMNDPIIDSERSTTYYDFQGLEISELRWWHYAYEVNAPAFNGTSEAAPGATSVTVGNDTVTYAGVLYDYPDPGTSTWFYVVESGEQPEISHVTFDISDATNVVNGVNGAGTWSGAFPHVQLHSGGGDPEIGYDRKTAAWGLKFDEGFQAYQARRYYFTVDGNYQRTAIPVLTKAGPSADAAPITGPSLAESLSQSIVSFSLIDTDTDQPVPGYETIENGATLDLAYLPTNFTIRANANPTVVGSVRLDLDGEINFKTENHLPYCLMGDSNGDYAPWNPAVGTHQLVATPYTEGLLGGSAGIPGMLQFTVINTAQQIGHDRSSFLSDIGFHLNGDIEIVARVYPPAGNAKCTLPSEPTRTIFSLIQGTSPTETVIASN